MSEGDVGEGVGRMKRRKKEREERRRVGRHRVVEKDR